MSAGSDLPLEDLSRDDLLRLSEVHNRATKAELRVIELEKKLREICEAIEKTDQVELWALRGLAIEGLRLLEKREVLPGNAQGQLAGQGRGAALREPQDPGT